MRISYFLLFLATLTICETAKKSSWKDGDIETLLSKDRIILERAYGAVQELNQLLQEKLISNGTFNHRLGNHFATISAFVNGNITSLEEANEVFEYFVSSEKGYSKASRTQGVMTFTNVLFIIAIVVVVIACSSVFAIFIVPLIMYLPESMKVTLAFIGAFLILFIAKTLTSPGVQPYIALLGSLALGGAYFYALSLFPKTNNTPLVTILGVLAFAWGLLAIYFQSKMGSYLD